MGGTPDPRTGRDGGEYHRPAPAKMRRRRPPFFARSVIVRTRGKIRPTSPNLSPTVPRLCVHPPPVRDDQIDEHGEHCEARGTPKPLSRVLLPYHPVRCSWACPCPACFRCRGVCSAAVGENET